MLYELEIGGDIEQKEIDAGFYLRQSIEAKSCKEAISILMSNAPHGAKVLWARDENQRVLMYDNNEDLGYEYALNKVELQRIFCNVLPAWPNRIDVSVKHWHDNDGCSIPNLSKVWDKMEQHFASEDEEGNLSKEADLAQLIVWFVFGILHDQAKKTDQFVYPQDIRFDEIEACVKRDCLGWANEKPSQKWVEE